MQAGDAPVRMVPASILGGMATFPIRQFGDPVLKQHARVVGEFDGALTRLVETMVDTLEDCGNGIALAAPQVGVQKRLFVWDLDDGPEVAVNPEIVESSGEWVYSEGCLSIPGLYYDIVRPKVVTMRAQDLDGHEIVFEADELMARMFQHEIDHLDGVLMLEHLDPDDRKEALRILRERVPADTGVPGLL